MGKIGHVATKIGVDRTNKSCGRLGSKLIITFENVQKKKKMIEMIQLLTKYPSF